MNLAKRIDRDMAKTKKAFGELPLRQQKRLFYAHSREIARLQKSIAAKKEAIESEKTGASMAA